MYRTRTRGTIQEEKPGKVRFRGFEPGSSWTTVDNPRTCITSFESIVDVVGDFGGNHPCSHTKYDFVDFGLGGCNSYDWNEVQPTGGSMFLASQLPDIVAVDGEARTTCANNMLARFNGHPPPDVNLAQNLAELKQTLSIPKAIARLTGAYSVWRTYLSPLAKSKGFDFSLLGYINNPRNREAARREARRIGRWIQADLKTFPKDVSDAFLLWSFGLKPLINDIQASEGVVERTISVLEGLNATNHRWQKQTGRHTVVGAATPYPSSCGAHTFIPVVDRNVAKLTVGVEVRTSYQGLQAALDELKGVKRFGKAGFRAMAHSLGFSSLPLLAWELVPWSFVADWFANIGKYVQQWGFAIVPGTFELRNPHTSVRGSLGFQLLYGNHVPSYTFGGTTRANTFYHTGVGERKSYSREPSLPQISTDLDELTPGQSALLGALLTQLLYKA